MLLVKEIYVNKLKYKELIFFIICIVLSLIILYNNNESKLAYPMFLFLYSARDIDLKKICKVTIVEEIILIVFIIGSAKIGIITDYVLYTAERTRAYLGFRYSLYLPKLLFNITALILYCKKRVKIGDIIIICFLNYLAYYFSNSRLSFFLSIALAIIVYIYSILKNGKIVNRFFNNKIVRIAFIGTYIFSAIIGIVVTINYNPNNKKYKDLNRVLENRLYYGQKALKENGSSLVGEKIQFVGNGLDYERNEKYRRI